MSFHDEPMVVENGPVGIDVGETHADTARGLLQQVPTTNNWLRKVSQFNRIVLICKSGQGVNETIETKSTELVREPGKDIKLTLDNGATLTLSWSGTSHDDLTIKPSNFPLSKSGRRLTQGNQNLKISLVEWFEFDGQATPSRFPSPAAGSNHDSIFIGLYA
jgi:hypothetical protein